MGHDRCAAAAAVATARAAPSALRVARASPAPSAIAKSTCGPQRATSSASSVGAPWVAWRVPVLVPEVTSHGSAQWLATENIDGNCNAGSSAGLAGSISGAALDVTKVLERSVSDFIGVCLMAAKDVGDAFDERGHELDQFADNVGMVLQGQRRLGAGELT